MSPAIWICLFLMLLVIFLQQRMQRLAAVRHVLKIKRAKKGRIPAMSDMIDRFIGKECMIYTMNSNIAGKILAAENGWILVDNGHESESVNLDYIVRIREYPRNKNGKKKSIVTD